MVGIRETRKTVVTGVEMFRKLLDEAQAGDNVGSVCFAVSTRKIWSAGWCWRWPGSITPHKKFKAEVYVLTKEEGGRHTPFFNGYRPQFYFRTTDVTGVVKMPEGVEMVMPGDNMTMEMELITPIAMEKELRFRDPRGWPHDRRRCHRARSWNNVERHEKIYGNAKDQDSTQSVRSLFARSLDQGDRPDGAAHRRARSSVRCRFRPSGPSTRCCGRRMSTKNRASSSRPAFTSD